MKMSNIQKHELLKRLRAEATGVSYHGRIVLQLKIDSDGLTERCCFCGQKHSHGAASGDRAPHCCRDIFGLPVDENLVFQNRIGQLFFKRDGYELICDRND